MGFEFLSGRYGKQRHGRCSIWMLGQLPGSSKKAAAHGSFAAAGGQDRFKPQWPQGGPSRRKGRGKLGGGGRGGAPS